MACTSVVFPAPRSPAIVTIRGGKALLPKRSPHEANSASLQARRPCSARGGMTGSCDTLFRARGSLLRAARTDLEQLIAQLCRELEIHCGGGFLHLFFE